MTPDELHAILHDLNWSLGELARTARREKRAVQKMASGREPIDEALANWLRAVRDLWPAPQPPDRDWRHEAWTGV